MYFGAALTVLLTTASCARPSETGASDPPSDVVSTTVSSPSQPDASGLPPALRPNVAVPDARVTALKPIRWTRAVAATGRDLQVHYTITGRGDCSALGRVDVAETARDVTVTVLVGRLPGADCDGPQPQLAASVMTVVKLATPLGDRAVRDGAAS
jgi:hypothetical protein